MVLSNKYDSYIASNRELYSLMGEGCCGASKDSFEEIYKKAKDIKPDDAKEFLNSLSASEMETIREYQSLANPIDIGIISSEGAANLLLHRYEQIDFDDDGLTEVGLAKTFGLFNQDMSQDFRSSVISALSFRFNAPSLQGSKSQANSSVGFEDVKEMIEEINSPNYQGYIAEELKESLNLFFEYFESAWNKTGRGDGEQKTDSEVEQFLKELSEKGAAAFLQKLNNEKIEKMIEKKRAELEEKYGLNANPPLEGEAKKDAIEALNKELEEYIKELHDKLNKKAKLEKTKKLTLNDLLSEEWK